MKMNIKKSLLRVAGFFCLSGSMVLASCSAEPDDSDLYTFTGETIEDFIVNNEASFSDFNYILQRAGYDRILSSYGTYTCFVPTNEAVRTYVNELYNDEDAMLPHHGMPEVADKNNVPLENLTDSLCRSIAMYHVAGIEYKTASLGASGVVTPLSGPQINTGIAESGDVILNDKAVITNADYEVVNGIVHVINSVIPRANKLISTDLLKDGRFSIFSEALRLTGLDQQMERIKKNPFTIEAPEIKPGEDGETSYWVTPEPSDIKFTIFAETDEVFRANGINSVEDLVRKAAEWYGKAATGSTRTDTEGWYDWYRNNNVTIDTDVNGDYTKENHVLNMFIRYHILAYGVAKNSLTIDYCVYDKSGWSGDSYDYYETTLPKTLLKVWYVKKERKYYINRYVTNNTLSDGVGENVETMGSEAMHTLVYQGVWIDVDNSISSLNGYIYPVNDILLYNSQVPNGVLNERMRFDTLSMLGEVMSSGFRGIYCQDMVSRSGNSSVGRIRFPVDYFDNIVVYNGNKTKLDMNLLANPGNNSFLLYKGDSFQGKGVYDFAIKLPPVPDGMYELRVAATNFGQRGSMMQFYLGESPDLNDLKPIDIPIDLRLPTSTLSGSEEDKARLLSIGYCEINNEDAYPDAYADRGVESDKVMRTHSYMRDGLSIVKESDGSNYKPVTYNARFAGYQLRRILTKENLKQRDYWLRVKSVLPKYDDKKFQLDYIEIVPQRVYDGVGAYREDLY